MTDKEIDDLLKFVSADDPTPLKSITYRKDSAILNIAPTETHGTYTLRKDSGLSNALALIVQRNEVFGPFFRYPKTLIIAPEFFQGEVFLKGSLEQDYQKKLHLRDYEKLIYITQKIDHYCIHCVQFFLNFTNPDSAKGRMVVFYTKNHVVTSTWEQDEVLEVKNIGDFIFQMSNATYNIMPQAHIFAANEKSQIKQTISIVDFLARNSGDIWTTSYLNAMEKALSPSDAVLLAEKIGLFPYTSPFNKKQTGRPVPVGEVTPDRLVEVSDIIKKIRNPSIKAIETPIRDYPSEETLVYNYSSEESDLI